MRNSRFYNHFSSSYVGIAEVRVLLSVLIPLAVRKLGSIPIIDRLEKSQKMNMYCKFNKTDKNKLDYPKSVQ